jgi:acetate kinase
MRYSNFRGQKIEKDISANSYEAAISEACLALVETTYGVITNLCEIEGIGHRVVHGGADITASSRITPNIKQIIMDCFSLAPLHNPPNYECIEACEHLFPNVPMVAVFDTAFHQTMPAAAYTYAIPAAIAAKNKIRRYGFPRHITSVRVRPRSGDSGTAAYGIETDYSAPRQRQQHCRRQSRQG